MGFLSIGCSPKFFISFDDLRPGLASAISVIALFNPMLNISDGTSKDADFFPHFN